MYELGKPPIPMTVKCLSFLWLSWGKWITQGHREMCETLRARHPWAPVGRTVAYHGNVTGEPWRYCGVNMHVHQMEIWMDGWSYIYIYLPFDTLMDWCIYRESWQRFVHSQGGIRKIMAYTHRMIEKIAAKCLVDGWCWWTLLIPLIHRWLVAVFPWSIKCTNYSVANTLRILRRPEICWLIPGARSWVRHFERFVQSIANAEGWRARVFRVITICWVNPSNQPMPIQ